MIIEKNIETLQRNEMHWVGQITPTSITHQYIAKENEKIEYFKNTNGETFKTQDSFDPDFQANSFKKEIVFAIGINSIQELNHLYKKINKDSFLVILEPNQSFFNYVLNNKSLDIFDKNNVILYSDEIINLNDFLRGFFSKFSTLALAKNITFYQTDYYRNYDFKITKKIIQSIRDVVRNVILSVGNSVEDGLDGLKNNLENINWLTKSKDVSKLKGKYNGKPAIIVSAGPSLNKNIQELKRAENKAIIIAVDTIVSKLITEGIVPDFICSIERVEIVYDYFYMEKNIPKEVTLVGPSLLDPKIFKGFQGNMLLPLRSGVAEYYWLEKIMGLNKECFTEMGSSCAHTAFGIAMHLGASPIILVGQDLAYGSESGQSHAIGTIYDNKSSGQKVESLFKDYEVEGYHGEQVRTTYIWGYFKEWFEAQIVNYQLQVINATEGGARIHSTIQKTLKETIDLYCLNDIPSVYDFIEHLPIYDISLVEVKRKLEEELDSLTSFREKCSKRLNTVNQIKITSSSSKKTAAKAVGELNKTNSIMTKIVAHNLLRHNLQSIVVKSLWDLNNIEQVINSENVLKNKEIQIKLLTPTIVCIEKIESYLIEAITALNSESR